MAAPRLKVDLDNAEIRASVKTSDQHVVATFTDEICLLPEKALHITLTS